MRSGRFAVRPSERARGRSAPARSKWGVGMPCQLMLPCESERATVAGGDLLRALTPGGRSHALAIAGEAQPNTAWAAASGALLAGGARHRDSASRRLRTGTGDFRRGPVAASPRVLRSRAGGAGEGAFGGGRERPGRLAATGASQRAASAGSAQLRHAAVSRHSAADARSRNGGIAAQRRFGLRCVVQYERGARGSLALSARRDETLPGTTSKEPRHVAPARSAVLRPLGAALWPRLVRRTACGARPAPWERGRTPRRPRRG